MKNILLLFFFVTMMSNSFAGFPLKRLFQDEKLPTQLLIEHQLITAPSTTGTANILSANAGITSAVAVNVTSFVAQPDVPRNIVITPGSTTANVNAGTIVVTGTNFFGSTITENFAITGSQSSATTGAKAFKTVSNVLFPATIEVSPYQATWSIGYGQLLGMKRCMDFTGSLISSLFNGILEATRSTITASSSAVESNTVSLNSTLNGAKNVDLYFVQDFGCFP